MLVGGEAGIGKTSFVTALAESFQPPGRVLWGACDPLFTPRPLGPIYDIAVGDLPHLLDLLNSGADWLAIAAALHKNLAGKPDPDHARVRGYSLGGRGHAGPGSSTWAGVCSRPKHCSS